MSHFSEIDAETVNEEREARECPLCTEWVEADDEGFLDCPNCGAHLEPTP